MSNFDPTDESTWYPNKRNTDAQTGWYQSEDPADFQKDDKTGERVSNVLGRFEWHDLLDRKKSLDADREIYKKIPICKTKVRASNPEDISSRKVTEKNIEELVRKFPKAWAEFRNEEVAIDGTPVTDVPGVTKDVAIKLEFDGIRTAEDLATLTDEQCKAKGFGWTRHRDAAREMVGSTKEDKAEAVPAEIAALKAQNEVLQRQMQELMANMTAAQNTAPAAPVDEETASEDKPKRRGRPRKAETVDAEAAA